DRVSAPPRTTAIGALAYYASHANPAHYEPSNITFGIMQPLEKAPRGKQPRNHALSARALADLQAWISVLGPGLETHAHPSESLPPVSPTYPERVGAHGARLRQRSLAVSRTHSRVACGEAQRTGAGAARSLRDSQFHGRTAQAGTVARKRRAEARVDSHVPA